MKKTLLITGVLLALTATVASAAGINMYWNDCSAAGTNAKTFACTANTGSNTLTVSFDPPANVTMLNGIDMLVDLQSASDPLPQWWMFKNPGTCRLASLGANTVFSSAQCTEPWAAAGNGAVSAYIAPSSATNRARLAGTVSVGGPLAGPVDPGTEYYAINFTINNAKSTGTGACAGCLDPVCLVLNDVLLSQPAGTPGGSPRITNPRDNNFATWQGFAIGGAGCPGATPTVNRT
jgi:hypothetical protein